MDVHDVYAEMLEYLDRQGFDMSRVPGEIRFCRDQGRSNDEDHRAFAHVSDDDLNVIHVALQIEALPARNKIAILLHEIGHAYMNYMEDDQSEVEVDTWVLSAFPRSGYGYEDVEYTWRHETRVASSLQTVSNRFVREVLG